MSGSFFESFDNGIGALNHTWGSGIDTSVSGQVTISGYSGIMEKPWGDAAGHGYGTYKIVARLSGNAEGPAALLWPGNDRWPGPEMDIVEYIHDHAYAALHYDNNGRDGYHIINYDGLDPSQTHTYEVKWEPGRISLSVDGRSYGSFTQNVGADYDHGGLNSTISIMNRGHNPGTSITVYEVGYTPLGGSHVAEPFESEGSWEASDAPRVSTTRTVAEPSEWLKQNPWATGFDWAF